MLALPLFVWQSKKTMGHERASVTHYDTEKNLEFRDALINDLVAPACVRAIEICRGDQDLEHGVVSLGDEEKCLGGGRKTYDFYTEENTGNITVRSVTYTKIDRMTTEARRVILGEITASDYFDDDSRDVTDCFGDLSHDASVETYVCRLFRVGLETGNVRVITSMGYAVNGKDVVSRFDDEKSKSEELDVQREMFFGADEVIEIVDALYAMDLITQDEVQQFLDQYLL